jgi:hypothetical protein
MNRQILSSLLVIVASTFILMVPQRVDAQTTPTPVKEVSPPGSTPYATNFSISIVSGSGANGFSPNVVPARKRLVIEFVSIAVVLDPTESPLFSLQDSVKGISHSYVLALTPVSQGASEWRTTQLVKLYHDGNGANGPGATCSRRQNSFSSMTCDITISGYLIDK